MDRSSPRRVSRRANIPICNKDPRRLTCQKITNGRISAATVGGELSCSSRREASSLSTPSPVTPARARARVFTGSLSLFAQPPRSRAVPPSSTPPRPPSPQAVAAHMSRVNARCYDASKKKNVSARCDVRIIIPGPGRREEEPTSPTHSLPPPFSRQLSERTVRGTPRAIVG